MVTVSLNPEKVKFFLDNLGILVAVGYTAGGREECDAASARE
jgi:hypothetical protein